MAVSEADCGRGNTRDAPRPSSMGSTHRSQSDSDRSICYQESALLSYPRMAACIFSGTWNSRGKADAVWDVK